jgi:hypothetical protein
LAISRARDGRLLLAWSGYGDAQRESDLFARLLRADGEPEGAAFRVTGVTEGHQILQPASGARHARLLDDGRMAFAWSGNADLGDSNAAHFTLLAPKGFEFGALPPPGPRRPRRRRRSAPEEPARAAAPGTTCRRPSARDRANRADYQTRAWRAHLDSSA